MLGRSVSIEKNVDMDIGALIFQKLKEKERSIAWLAKRLDCDDSNLRKMLKGTRYINTDLLLNISIVLEEDLFASYSKRLAEIVEGRIDQQIRSH